MKKNIILFAALLMTGVAAFGQVGINTETPKTTMDVSAKRNSSGIITDNTQTYGLQAPRLTRAELTANTATYAADQKGALIYITDVSGGDTSAPRTNVDAAGYYYFDGSLWQKVGAGGSGATVTANNGLTKTADNIQLGGALTKATNISGISATNKLTFTGTGVDAVNFDSNTLSIDADNNRVGVGTAAPEVTLDIKGVPATTTVADGIIAPRLTGNQLKAKDALYTTAKTGTMVYVTSAASPTTPKTVNVTSEGYYYFDGSVWIRFQQLSEQTGNCVVKQRLITASSSVIINSCDGMYSFRYSSTAINGFWQIRYNGIGTRQISTFVVENWLQNNNGYFVDASSYTLAAGTWTSIGTNVGSPNELNTIRIYDLTSGITMRFEGNLLNNSGLKEAMILEVF